MRKQKESEAMSSSLSEDLVQGLRGSPVHGARTFTLRKQQSDFMNPNERRFNDPK
jgi:hypothetical protein